MADITRQLAQAPLPQIIESLGVAICRAQDAMDRVSLEILAKMVETEIVLDPKTDLRRSMLELGFTPSFYHITEATVETRVAFSTSTTTEQSVSATARYGSELSLAAASINASYTNKYSFNAEGSSRVVAKFVSLPPPPSLADAISKLRK